MTCFLRKFAAWFLQTQTCDAPEAKAGKMQRMSSNDCQPCVVLLLTLTKMTEPWTLDRFWLCFWVSLQNRMPQTLQTCATIEFSGPDSAEETAEDLRAETCGLQGIAIDLLR